MNYKVHANVLQDGHIDDITGPRCIVKPTEGKYQGRYLIAHTDEVLEEGQSVTFDYITRRATPSPQPNMRVKPLIWRVPKEDSPKDPSAEDIALCADGIGGIYGISRKQSVGPERLVWWVDDPFTWTGYASIAEAKAAAQADHDTRVLALIVTNHGCKSDLHPEYVTSEDGTDHGYKSALYPGSVPPEGDR